MSFSGNDAKARIYLSIENRSVLDRQLQETYGESFAELLGGESRSRFMRATFGGAARVLVGRGRVAVTSADYPAQFAASPCAR